jgi:hypothetical protein
VCFPRQQGISPKTVTQIIFLGNEFLLILLLSTLSCWIFGVFWLIFGKISQIILPLFMFAFGTLLILIAVWMFCMQRSQLTNDQICVTTSRKVDTLKVSPQFLSIYNYSNFTIQSFGIQFRIDKQVLLALHNVYILHFKEMIISHPTSPQILHSRGDRVSPRTFHRATELG